MSDPPRDPSRCWLTSSHSLLPKAQPLPVALPHCRCAGPLRHGQSVNDYVGFREPICARDLLRIAIVLQIASVLTEVA